jgi:hypothetical protein
MTAPIFERKIEAKTLDAPINLVIGMSVFLGSNIPMDAAVRLTNAATGKCAFLACSFWLVDLRAAGGMVQLPTRVFSRGSYQ